MFPGFDFMIYDDRLAVMRRWSNLRVVGFYLAHSAGGKETSWHAHWHDLKDMGFAAWALWVPFNHKTVVREMRGAAKGQLHGERAAARARAAELERGTALFLDIELPILSSDRDHQHLDYVTSWIEAVRAVGYSAGIYCSRLDVISILTLPRLKRLRPFVWPVAIRKFNTRAEWNQTTFQLTPATPSQWPVIPGEGAWVNDPDVVGCQYDWYRSDRQIQTMTWPDGNGHLDRGPGGSRDMDWDSSKVVDPSHPRAGIIVATCNDGSSATSDVFSASVTQIETRRLNDGAMSERVLVANSPADIGPNPAAALDGFDPSALAAVSCDRDRIDGFVLGQDGLIRTFWRTATESYPHHTEPVNAGHPARGGGPLAAVTRVPNQIDLLFADTRHRLVCQSTDPRVPNWAATRLVIGGPLVAGGSNLVALPSSADGVRSDRVDAFYVQMDFNRERWRESLRAVHATRTAVGGQWQVAEIPGIGNVAAASGIAATRDANGALHAIAQNRARTALVCATRGAGPRDEWQALPTPPALAGTPAGRSWWMRIYLTSMNDGLVLFGITSNGKFATSTFAGNAWSEVSVAESTFSAGRPLAFVKSDEGVIDIVGVTEEGELVVRRLRPTNGNTVWALEATIANAGTRRA